MKRMLKREREQGGEIRGVKHADLARVVGGDVYLQFPRGSNNRLTDTDVPTP